MHVDEGLDDTSPRSDIVFDSMKEDCDEMGGLGVSSLNPLGVPLRS